MDPDGTPIGVCFHTPTLDATRLYFLPLGPQEGGCAIDLSWEVSAHEREAALISLLRSSSTQVIQCFDLQGTLRRLARHSERIRRIVHPESRLLCLKLLAWMCEPGLAHDKILSDYSLASVCQLKGIPIDRDCEGEGEGEGGMTAPFASVWSELHAMVALSSALGEEQAARGRNLGFLLHAEVHIADLLSKMECEGIAFNLAELRTHETNIKASLARLEQTAFACAGEEFNLRSPPQLSRVLFDVLKAGRYARGKSSSTGTDEQTLKLLLKAPEPLISRLASAVLEHRRLAQVVSKYIESDWLEQAKLQAKGGGGGEGRVEADVVHVTCQWNQTATATGRLSASNPNLQAVTKYVVDGINIRNAFIPRPGSVLLSIDYSQIEIRLLAHLSKDARLIQLLNSSNQAAQADVFTMMSRTWLASVPCLPHQKASPRDVAKRTAYSIIYGTTAFALAMQLGIDVASGVRLIRSFLSHFQGISAFTVRTKADARRNGFVETILGRRRGLPDIASRDQGKREAAERQAVNTVVQGSAADLIKLAMCRWWRRLHDEGEGGRLGQAARLVAQIHDELLIEVSDPAHNLDWVAKTVAEMMSTVQRLDVPIEVNIQSGPSWGALA